MRATPNFAQTPPTVSPDSSVRYTVCGEASHLHACARHGTRAISNGRADARSGALACSRTVEGHGGVWCDSHAHLHGVGGHGCGRVWKGVEGGGRGWKGVALGGCERRGWQAVTGRPREGGVSRDEGGRGWRSKHVVWRGVEVLGSGGRDAASTHFCFGGGSEAFRFFEELPPAPLASSTGGGGARCRAVTAPTRTNPMRS